MRVVLDTNVVVSALIWGGTPFKLLQVATDGHLTLCTSPALLAELREVLHRDHLARRLAQQQTSIDDAIRWYAAMAISVTPLTTPRAVPKDVDDDQVIACAVAAGAPLIVSGDSDLLVLHPWREIQILNATAALQVVMNGKAQS
jgi:putative PIN family toxin of toxin-antitoxin system